MFSSTWLGRQHAGIQNMSQSLNLRKSTSSRHMDSITSRSSSQRSLHSNSNSNSNSVSSEIHSNLDSSSAISTTTTSTTSSSSNTSESESDFDGPSSEAPYSSDSEDLTWIDWFLHRPENKYLLPVPEEFIEDEFNLTGLPSYVKFYDEAITTILNYDEATGSEYEKQIQASAETLYLLIHARYIITKPGLMALFNKVCSRSFGMCPRTFCHRYPVVPIGESDKPNENTIKLYCHNCQDIYYPSSHRLARMDGAAFGTTAAHLLFLSFPSLHQEILRSLAISQHEPVLYVPRIFGFRVNEQAVGGGTHAYWLRYKPGVDLQTGRTWDSLRNEHGLLNEEEQVSETEIRRRRLCQTYSEPLLHSP